MLQRLDVNSIEEGSWLHLLDPEDGEPMYRDPETKLLPCKAQVRSDQSEAVTLADRKANRVFQEQAQRVSAAKRKEMVDEATEAGVVRRFSRILVSLENCAEQKGVVQVSEEDAKAIYTDKSMRWMVNQIFAYAGEQANYAVPRVAAPKGGAGTKTNASAKA